MILFLISAYIIKINTPEICYISVQGKIPYSIEKIIFITRPKVDIPGYPVGNSAKYHVNESTIYFIDNPCQNLSTFSRTFPKLFNEDGKVHYIYREGGKNINTVLRDMYLVKYEEYEALEITKDNLKYVKITDDKDNTNIFTDYSILFKENYYHILEHYPMEYSKLRFVEKNEDSIYLNNGKYIYRIDKNYKWEKIYKSSQYRTTLKYAYGIRNMHIYNNKLYFIERVFYPESLSRLLPFYFDLFAFKEVQYLKVLDLSTNKIIKKYLWPNNVAQLFTNSYNEFPFRVLNDDKIVIAGNYIIDFEKRQITDFELNFPSNPIFRKNIDEYYATDFCIIKREEQ